MCTCDARDIPSVFQITSRFCFTLVTGSGAPFHFHCPALNALVYGRKKYNIL